MSQSETPNLKTLIKDACKKFGVKEMASVAKLYNKNGIEMLKDDAQYIKNGDVFYLAIDGKSISTHTSASEPRY